MKTKPIVLLLFVSFVFFNNSCQKSSEQQYVFVVEEGTLTDKAGIHSSNPQAVEKIYPGVKIKMTYNPVSNSIKFENFDLYFTSGNFKNVDGAKGGVQMLRFSLFDFEAKLDVNSGKISEGSNVCYYIQAAELLGGKGLLCFGDINDSESTIEDSNSPVFDLSNGLGCKGKLKLSLFFGNATPPMSVKLVAKLLQEDLDGDSIFDNICIPPKEFEVLYDPPKLNVIFPGPLYIAQYSDIYTIQFIEINELIKGYNQEANIENIQNEISELIFNNSSSLQIIIFDSNKNIVMGDLSDSDTKAFNIELEEYKDYFVGIMPLLPLSEKLFYDFP